MSSVELMSALQIFDDDDDDDVTPQLAGEGVRNPGCMYTHTRAHARTHARTRY